MQLETVLLWSYLLLHFKARYPLQSTGIHWFCDGHKRKVLLTERQKLLKKCYKTTCFQKQLLIYNIEWDVYTYPPLLTSNLEWHLQCFNGVFTLVSSPLSLSLPPFLPLPLSLPPSLSLFPSSLLLLLLPLLPPSLGKLVVESSINNIGVKWDVCTCKNLEIGSLEYKKVKRVHIPSKIWPCHVWKNCKWKSVKKLVAANSHVYFYLPNPITRKSMWKLVTVHILGLSKCLPFCLYFQLQLGNLAVTNFYMFFFPSGDGVHCGWVKFVLINSHYSNKVS